MKRKQTPPGGPTRALIGRPRRETSEAFTAADAELTELTELTGLTGLIEPKRKKPNLKQLIDVTTEERIMVSARNLFMKHGYAATRTRDIAEASGVNLALLNYYFRTKENLFAQIMTETLSGFMMGMKMVFNNEQTSLYEKVTLFVNRYIDLLALQPDLPLFIFSSLRTNPLKLSQKVGARDVFLKSHFTTQYNAAVKDGSISELPIMHFVMNLVGMTVFPFVARPMLEAVGNLAPNTFDKMMQERRALIPVWIEALMNVQL